MSTAGNGNTLLPPTTIGGSFYADPDHDAGDTLDSLFGPPPADNADTDEGEEFDDTDDGEGGRLPRHPQRPSRRSAPSPP